MVKLALQVSGWLLAHLPERVVAFLAAVLGRLVYAVLGSRRRLALSNLHHAFPGRPAEWHRATARECFRRFVETAFLSLAAPFLPPARFRRIATPAADWREAIAEHRIRPYAAVIGPPHFAHWEIQTAQAALVDEPFPEYAAIYRPIDNPSADAWVKRGRERFGMKLLSRREGFVEAVRVLKRAGHVAVLFDQNAGLQGSLTLLLDRVCSTTELPGILAAKTGARVYGLYPRYLGFWRVELHLERIEHDGTAAGATIALNRWVERLLRGDDNVCASWLWGHQRWKTQDTPPARLRLEMKRNLLPDELAARGLPALPRRTRLWIRLPNWLGDVAMALPLLRAIRASRPDAEITLLAKAPFAGLLHDLGVADRVLPLPARGAGYFPAFARRRGEFPDCCILFTNSARGDLEAWLTGCRQRFGMLRPGKWRPLLSHAYRVPADYAEPEHHQLELWTDFLRSFGLAAEPDRTPFSLPGLRAGSGEIGLICGSENNPEKRWPVARWRALIAALPDRRFVLFGTAADRALTSAVAEKFGDRVDNRAGRTDLRAFAAGLQACTLLVTNDTGGMHLANALGVPLVALFGPTNPVRTGPVFTAPAVLLQPPGCARTGGGDLSALAADTVARAVEELLARRPA